MGGGVEGGWVHPVYLLLEWVRVRVESLFNFTKFSKTLTPNKIHNIIYLDCDSLFNLIFFSHHGYW